MGTVAYYGRWRKTMSRRLVFEVGLEGETFGVLVLFCNEW